MLSEEFTRLERERGRDALVSGYGLQWEWLELGRRGNCFFDFEKVDHIKYRAQRPLSKSEAIEKHSS